MDKKTVCLIASSGGHFEQIMMLKRLEIDYNIFYVTERTKYTTTSDKISFLFQVNRREVLLIPKLIANIFLSILIYMKNKPDVIISTGALSVIPLFLICKFHKKKLIFIESYAKSESPTLTGKFLYKISDLFIIQWEELREFYPRSIYLGSIY